MLSKPVWLLAAIFGVSATKIYVEDIRGELSQVIGTQTQRPLMSDEPPHYPNDKCSCTTIYRLISNDSRFSLVTKALGYVEDIAALLNDSTARITFFVPPDKVLRRSREQLGAYDLRSGDRSTFMPLVNLDMKSERDVPAVISEYGDLEEAIHAMVILESVGRTSGPDDDKRKKVIKAVIRAILRYHILPGVFDLEKFGENLTYATNLTVNGALDDQALRLRITQSVVPPATRINFSTRITRADIKALNGLVHVVDSPLIPPPSIFQQLYMLPHVFSTLTSALQRTGLNNFTDLRFGRGGKLTGASAVTLFAPTNDAFDALPSKLKRFLFSPFGEQALKKLIEYHIVPNAVVHSNYIHGEVIKPVGASDVGDDEECIDSWLKKHKHKKHQKPHHSELISVRNLTLVSLLPDHTLDTVITRERVTFPEEVSRKHKHKHKYKHEHKKHSEYHLTNTKVIVNDQPATVIDVVAFNGAIHTIDSLLDPRHCRCGGTSVSPTYYESVGSWADANEDEYEANGDIWDGWDGWFPD